VLRSYVTRRTKNTGFSGPKGPEKSSRLCGIGILLKLTPKESLLT
jgi:hypothetical protein